MAETQTISEQRATAQPTFTTTRAELWQALVEDLSHDWVETRGKFGPGRAYYTLNSDLFRAFREFCDKKEAHSA